MTTTPMRKAPGQRGGEPWKGPRRRVTCRFDLTTAELLKMRAREAGVSVTQFIEDAVRERLE